MPNFGIQSPTALAKDPPCSPPVGSGPFMIQSFTPAQSLTLVRNPGYDSVEPLGKHTGRPYLDQVTIRFVSDDAVRDGAVQSGQVDLADAILPKDIDSISSSGYSVLETRIPGVPDTLYLNTTNAPFDDVRVRQAFQRSIDLDSILGALYQGVYKRAWSPLSSVTVGFDKSLVGSWAPNPTLADRLPRPGGLDRTGRLGLQDEERPAPGRRMASGRPPRAAGPAGAADQEPGREGGDRPRAPGRLPGAIAQVLGNQYDITDFPFYRNDPDILRSLFNGGNQPTSTVYRQNVARVKDKQVNTWTEAAARTLNPAKRAKLYAEVQTAAIKNAWVVPLYDLLEVVAIKKSLHGVVLDGGQRYPVFYDVWADQQ